jgi:bifunctional DNase/RNase
MALARVPAASEENIMVEVALARIVINETSDEQVIVLKEKGGKRSFPIMIGIFEALAINRIVNERQLPRPLTHELLVSVVHTLGGKITRCVVTELKNNTYFALLSVERDGQTFEIDSRPSDGITLALHEGAQIFVDESVMDAVATEEDPTV